MKTYTLTRGSDHDYGYLGAVPREWWQLLGDWTTIDGQASLARGGDELSLVLAGIPSERRDVFGRSIRFTVVVEAKEADSERCGKLALASLSEPGRAALGKALDGALTAPEIDHSLANLVPVPDLDRRVQDALAKVLVGQAPSAAAQVTVPPVGSWAGSIGDTLAESAFAARVRVLACGQPGYAATLNLVRSIERAESVAGELQQPAALLLPERTVKGIRLLKGKEPAAPQESLLDQVLTLGGRTDKSTILRWIKIGALILSAGALVFLIRWLVGRG